MATIFPMKLLVLLCTVLYGVLSLPLEPIPGKSGEDQVKDAVHKAELAAKNAALQNEKNGNSAEMRVAAIKAKLNALHSIKQHMQTVHKLHPELKSLRKWGHTNHPNNNFKSYNHQPYDFMSYHHFRRPRHRNTLSKMITLKDLARGAAVPNNYKEDTTLEDRLALEAEEDKKYANSDNDIYSSTRSSLSNQDTTQSIQNQVARESARELKEIQQQINAESQNSLGKTSMGPSNSGALFQGNPSAQKLGQQKPATRNDMMGVQSDLKNALSNAEGLNTDSNIMSPQVSNGENDIGGNAFTGLGEVKQPDEINQMNSNMGGISQMPNLGQSEQMGEGQATIEGPQGDNAQSAVSALAAGAGQAAVSNAQQPMIPNDVGGLGGPGEPSNPMESMGLQGPGNIKAADAGVLQGGNSLGGGEMMPGGSMESNSLEGANMKKSKINDLMLHLPSKQANQNV